MGFGYIAKYHIEVYVDGVQQTDFSWLNDYTISLPTNPPAGSVVQIKRNTTKSSRLVDFQDGSVLTENALDTDSNQMFYLAQESLDDSEESLKENVGGYLDAKGRRIANLAEPVAQQDAVTKHTLEYQYPDVQVVASHIADLHTVASDFTSAGLSIQDMGTIDVPLSGTPAGNGYIATVAQNISSITHAATAAVQAEASRLAAAASASSASTSESSASSSASTASAQAQRSSDWAEKLGATVDGTGYSAKYWAIVAAGYGGGGVTSFNTRNGNVTLSSSDVTVALGFTPLSSVDGSVTAAKLATTLDLGTVP